MVLKGKVAKEQSIEVRKISEDKTYCLYVFVTCIQCERKFITCWFNSSIYWTEKNCLFW